MQKSPASISRTATAATELRRKKFLGLTMLSMLFLDTVNQGMAHGAAGGPMPFMPPVTPAHSPANTNLPVGWGHTANDIGKSHGTVPLVPQTPGHANFSTLMPSTTHHAPVSTGLTFVVPKAGAYTTELGQSGNSLALDLTSTSTDIVLGSKLFGTAPLVTITVGGVKESFKPGSVVTAAEYVAIQQVLGGGSQGVTLSSTGAATGGSFSLNQVDKSTVASLTIPSSVTDLDYVSKSANISVNGDINNYGSIDAVSTSSKLVTGTISAADITNEVGASISAGSTAHPVDLTLQATNNISNAGSITSSGALTLNAGGNIVNALPSGVSATAPTIHAVNNLNFSTGSGNFTNAGVVASANNNINIATINATTDININGTGGSFQAKSGDINIRDNSYTGSANVNLTGGDFLSKNLNIYSGTGDIEGVVGQVTGNLNTIAGVEHVFADTKNLFLGNNTVSGDPTFASSGNIIINGTNTFGEDVSILATGNITATAATSDSIIDHGNDVVLVAGANITTGNGGFLNVGTTTIPTSTKNLGGATGTGNGGAGIQFATAQLGTGTAGSIDLTGSTAATIIDTSSAAGAGGNVTLQAVGNGGTNGQVLLSATSTINTSSTLAGNNGGQVVITSSATANATNIQVGNIVTSGASGGGTGGQVTITTQQAINNNVNFLRDGSILSGNLGGTGPAIANSSISTGNITTGGAAGSSAGTIGITAGGNITSGSIQAVGGGGAAAGGAGGNAAAITLTAGGTLTSNSIEAYGGGGGGGTGGHNATGGAGGQGGNGANISITAPTLAVTGEINTSSGGGGGGAGGGGYGTSAGGAGGTTVGTISLNDSTSFSVSASILAFCWRSRRLRNQPGRRRRRRIELRRRRRWWRRWHFCWRVQRRRRCGLRCLRRRRRRRCRSSNRRGWWRR